MAVWLSLMAGGACAQAASSAVPSTAPPAAQASAAVQGGERQGVPPPLGFDTVAQALAALQARDGAGTIVTHGDGWVIVAEPMAGAQWSFTPPGHAAYPAVVRRTIRRAADGATSVDTASLCEAPQAACTQLLAEFQALNSRITQAVKARGRQGSTQTPGP